MSLKSYKFTRCIKNVRYSVSSGSSLWSLNINSTVSDDDDDDDDDSAEEEEDDDENDTGLAAVYNDKFDVSSLLKRLTDD